LNFLLFSIVFAWISDSKKEKKKWVLLFECESEMGTSQSDGKMEGWLYLIRSNRIGLQYSRKRYFLLEGHHLKSFKAVPISNNQVHARTCFSLSFFLLFENESYLCALVLWVLGVRNCFVYVNVG
jgi:hypothetical protein